MSFTHITLTICEVGITRTPILLKKVRTSLEIFRFYQRSQTTNYMPSTFAIHLIHRILGDIIHTSEIIKLRLKEVKYVVPYHKASTTIGSGIFSQIPRFFLGQLFHLVYTNKSIWSVFHTKVQIICFPEPNVLRLQADSCVQSAFT